MQIDSLQIHNFRNLERVSLQAGAGVNWLYGDNGAGKTSVLEAIHVLGRGRSFRTRTMTPLIRDGASAMTVFAAGRHPERRLGIERRSSEWKGRIDGESCSRLSEFARALPLVVIDPSSHELIEGGPGERRAYLDWGLFHVEQPYLDNWKRYSRLLRQRNAALRASAAAGTLDALEIPLARAAEKIEQARVSYTQRLQQDLEMLQARLGFRLEPLTVRYRSQSESADEYAALWRKSRSRDLEHGYTREGPHRGELVVRMAGQVAATRLSRGQMKLAALLLKLGQMQHLTSADNTPILLLDDPVSELDSGHFEQLLDWVLCAPIQSWITAIQKPVLDQASLFHVEQGKILEMV